jgi:hypothetical protein
MPVPLQVYRARVPTSVVLAWFTFFPIPVYFLSNFLRVLAQDGLAYFNKNVKFQFCWKFQKNVKYAIQGFRVRFSSRPS